MVLAILYILGVIMLVFGGMQYGRTAPAIVPSYYMWYVALCACLIIAGIKLFPHAFDH
jgi:Na+/alanine symporter